MIKLVFHELISTIIFKIKCNIGDICKNLPMCKAVRRYKPSLKYCDYPLYFVQFQKAQMFWLILILSGITTYPSYAELWISDAKLQQGRVFFLYGILNTTGADEVTRLQIIDSGNVTMIDQIQIVQNERLFYSYDTVNMDAGNYTLILNHNGNAYRLPFEILQNNAKNNGIIELQAALLAFLDQFRSILFLSGL